MTDNIADTGIKMTRRSLVGAAPFVRAAAGLGTERAVAAEAPVKASNADKFPPLPSFKFSLENSNSQWKGAGGTAKEVNTSNFPLSRSIAGVSMRLQPGSLRELHWHAVAAEWAYVIEGHVMTTVVSPDGTVEKNEFGPGDTRAGKSGSCRRWSSRFRRRSPARGWTSRPARCGRCTGIRTRTSGSTIRRGGLASACSGPMAV